MPEHNFKVSLRGDEVSMDAGCGNGHTAMEAYDMLNDEDIIHAVNICEPSIQDLKKRG